MMKIPILIRVFLLYGQVVQFSEGCKRQPKTTTPSPTTTTTTSTTTVTFFTPSFVTDPKTFEVQEQDEIRLPCYVDSLGDFQIIWHKEREILTIGDTVQNDSRIHVENTENGNTIVIRQAEEEDAGEYVCQAFGENPVELKHTVNIITRPEVEPVPKSGLITVKEGEPATLACKITRGSPKPIINWELESGYPIFWFGPSNTIPETKKWSKGVYRCTADNGWKSPATAELRLDVQHAPDVSLVTLTDYTHSETQLEPKCTVTSSPKATVDWYKDGHKIEENENMIINMIAGKNENRHTLRLKGMGLGELNEDDVSSLRINRLGVYECKAKNELGEASKAIKVFRSCDRGQVQCYTDLKTEEN